MVSAELKKVSIFLTFQIRYTIVYSIFDIRK
jgi:hypothetical protein